MESPPPPTDVPRRRLPAASILAAFLCTAALLATSPRLPMTWDEGNAILRAEQLPRDWPYTTRLEGHPALAGIVIAVGRWTSAAWLGPLSAARFGPIVLMGLAAGAMFYRMGRDYSAAAAVGAVAALMLLPRLFAHAHLASLDGPLTSCWILAWATFPTAVDGRRACFSWRRAIIWGLALGLTFSCKATGWIAPLPFLAWLLVYRDRAAAKTLALGVAIALLVFFALNPPLWHAPLDGWVKFFDLNLHRARQPGLNIPVRFLGESYHLGNPLPWYNTLLWTAVTVPVGMLVLAAVGIAAAMRRWRTDRAGIHLVAHWLVLLVVRAMPITPPHDGVRLFLPSFAFLAALAGVGCGVILGRASRPPQREDEAPGLSALPARRAGRRLAVVVLGLVYAASASSLCWYAPQWLSYYSLPIGGLPGATAAGMEPTYYWDGLDRSVLDWLHTHTAQTEKVFFSSPSAENLRLMRRWGILRRNTQLDSEPGEFRWYVLQHRPGPWPWHPVDPWLIGHFEPVERKTIGPSALRAALRRRGLDVPWPWRLDVPLVDVYDYRQYLQARSATGGHDIRTERPF